MGPETKAAGGEPAAQGKWDVDLTGRILTQRMKKVNLSHNELSQALDCATALEDVGQRLGDHVIVAFARWIRQRLERAPGGPAAQPREVRR